MIKLICGDVFEEIKKIEDNYIDLSITSPPYNKQESQNKGQLVREVKYDQYSDTLPEHEYQDLQVQLLDEVYRITKDGGSYFYNHKLRWEKGNMYHPMDWLRKSKWVIRQEIIWNRSIAANIRGWRFWQNDERIYWLYKPINNNKIGKELQSKHAHLSSIWNIPAERNNEHPAPFPVTIPIRIIHSILNDDPGIVFDPYIGSGTTLVAAKLLNKDGIGIDISQEYITMTRYRLNNVWDTDIKKFHDEMKLHVVNKAKKIVSNFIDLE